MKPEDLQFRKLDFPGVKTLLEWAGKEGWNPGPHDAEVYWATDPDGFYGYFYSKGGFEMAFKNERYEKTGMELQLDRHIVPVKEDDLPFNYSVNFARSSA